MSDDEIVNPAGPWNEGRDKFVLDDQLSGRGNLDKWRATVTTENQRLSGKIHISGYKLNNKGNSKAKSDFYCVFGSFSHGVGHGGSYNPATNWVSVGYYATQMSLILELPDPDIVIWDSGPGSTVGSHEVGFNIGGNLSVGVDKDGPSAELGVSGSFGATFASPNVRFAQSTLQGLARWDVKLPGVGFVSPGTPANPEEPSYAGYQWYFGAIFDVPAGRQFSLNVKGNITWNFDYTRGITYDTKTFDKSQIYTYQGNN